MKSINLTAGLFLVFICLLYATSCDKANKNENGIEEELTWKYDYSGTLTISGKGVIPDYDFSNPPPWSAHQDKITRVIIGNGISSIGYGVFSSINTLLSIDVDNSNAALCSEDGVLFNKTKTALIQYPAGKTGAYIIPNSVTSIGRSAFGGCNNLTSVTIPNSVTSIGKQAFGACMGLTSIIIPDLVTSIEQHTFAGCHNLSSVTIGNSVTTIGTDAFHGCSFTSITIPNSVKTLRIFSFRSCYGLSSITIPSSVTSIEELAFALCYYLNEIINESTVPQTIGAQGLFGDFVGEMSARTLRVPAASLDAYRTAPVWKEFGNIVAI